MVRKHGVWGNVREMYLMSRHQRALMDAWIGCRQRLGDEFLEITCLLCCREEEPAVKGGRFFTGNAF